MPSRERGLPARPVLALPGDSQVKHPMMDVCAVCGEEVGEPSVGVGSMLFHQACLPTCKFCERPYVVQEAGWDFRGGVVWSDEWGYVPQLESAACPTCTDDAERRDYGAGW